MTTAAREPAARQDGELDAAWLRLSGAHTRVEQELSRGLRRSGLGLSEYRALALLGDAPESEIRMYDLADSLALNQSSISRLVARLEALGHVGRETCGDDRRGLFVFINDSGRSALAEARPVYRRLLADAVRREGDLLPIATQPSSSTRS